MALVKSNRDITIISIHGEACIKAFKVTKIPELLLGEALLRGAFRCDEDGNLEGLEGLLPVVAESSPATVVKEPAPPPKSVCLDDAPLESVAGMTNEERTARVRSAVVGVLASNDASEMRLNGFPTARAVSKRAGFSVSPVEVMVHVKALHREAEARA